MGSCSLIWEEGYAASCVPALISAVVNEIDGVAVQALLAGLLGAGFGACSVIWVIQFTIGKFMIKRMNANLHQTKRKHG